MLPLLVKAAIVAAALHHPAAHAAQVTVQPGDTLSGIAVSQCGPANDWTGIYTRNRTLIGANPNFILPGQRLTMQCTDPPSLLQLAQKPVAPVTTQLTGTYGHPNFCGDGDGDGWDVACKAAPAAPAAPAATVTVTAGTYGHPYYCGDGDGDGWDKPCAASPPAAPAAAPVRASVLVSSGTYSYTMLEQLWISAGGPGWAAAHAASIAICESGGNPAAYNPSGATGLWQILGAVVAGNLNNPYTNALNAVSKFNASGQTFAQWVCR